MDELTVQLIIAIIPLVIGVAILYWIGRRRFYRRSITGSEGFSSYESSIVIRFIERIGKWIAYILIIIGLIFLWSRSQMKKEKAEENVVVEDVR